MSRPADATAELADLVGRPAADDVQIRGHLRPDRDARRRRLDGVVARGDRRTAAGGDQGAAPHRGRPGRSAPRGRRWACTGRPSSTRATCRRSWPGRHRRTGPPSTRSSGPTSGTCCPTRNAAACWSNTERWAATYDQVLSNTVVGLRARRLRVVAGAGGRRTARHRRSDAASAGLRRQTACARGDPVLLRSPGGRRRRRRGAPVTGDAGPMNGPATRVRRGTAGRFRRSRERGRGDAVPAHRHPRARGPRRAARRGVAPLPGAGRCVADQRAEPRAAGRARGRTGGPRGLADPGAVGQPELGAVVDRRGRARPAPTAVHAAARTGDLRLLVLFVVPAVPRGLRRGLGRPRLVGRVRIDKVRPYFDQPGFLEPFADGTPRGRAMAALDGGCRPTSWRCCSPPTRSRRRWRTAPAPRPPATTGPAARTSPSIVAACGVGLRPRWPSAPARARRLAAGVPVPVRVAGRFRGWSRTSSTSSPICRPSDDGVVVVPIGFVSDHVEVIWDLDHEAADAAADRRSAVLAGAHAGHRSPIRRGPGRSGRRAGRPWICPHGAVLDSAPGDPTSAPPGCCVNLRGAETDHGRPGFGRGLGRHGRRRRLRWPRPASARRRTRDRSGAADRHQGQRPGPGPVRSDRRRGRRPLPPGAAVELVRIRTEGDVNRGPLATIGGTGVFVTAVRTALLAGEVDVVVHSFKDLPTAPGRGRCAGRGAAAGRTRSTRSAPATGCSSTTFPRGARVGTGSPRRAAQLLAVAARPDRVEPVRGNVDTRLATGADRRPWTRWCWPRPDWPGWTAAPRSPRRSTGR